MNNQSSLLRPVIFLSIGMAWLSLSFTFWQLAMCMTDTVPRFTPAVVAFSALPAAYAAWKHICNGFTFFLWILGVFLLILSLVGLTGPVPHYTETALAAFCMLGFAGFGALAIVYDSHHSEALFYFIDDDSLLSAS